MSKIRTKRGTTSALHVVFHGGVKKFSYYHEGCSRIPGNRASLDGYLERGR